MMSKPVNCIPPWPLNQLLPSGSIPDDEIRVFTHVQILHNVCNVCVCQNITWRPMDVHYVYVSFYLVEEFLLHFMAMLGFNHFHVVAA